MGMKRNVSAKAAEEKPAKNVKEMKEEVPLPEEPSEAVQEPETKAETKAVVVKENHAVAKPQGKMVQLYDDIENAFVAEYGVLTKLKASNGNVMDADDNLLGDTIDIQIMSWNKQFVVGPCANEAPAELVKYSTERDFFVDGSGSLNDYVQELKKEGWVKAAVKEYYEVVGMLTNSAKPSDLVGELVQLQLSPTSVKSFNGFKLQTAFKIARGLLPESAGSEVTVTVAVVTAKGNTWSKFDFKPKTQD